MHNMDVTTGVALANRVLPAVNLGLSIENLLRVGRDGGGLILCDHPGMEAARTLRQRGYSGPLVLDLIDATPDGQRTRAARRQACERVRELDVNVAELFTPSRRIRAGHDGDLLAQIEESRGLIEQAGGSRASVWMGLALDGRWLQDPRATERLRQRLSEVDAPVALAFASTHDPLGTRDSVKGLMRLLRVTGVACARTDLAGLAAVVHGAVFAGIGLSSGLRHLYIPRRRNRGRGDERPARQDRGLHVLVPGCLAWIEGRRLWQAGRHPELYCTCRAHPDGQWLGNYRDSLYREEAMLHAFYTWQAVLERLSAARSDEQTFEWGRICREAVEAVERLERETGVSFTKQPLRWWTAL